MDLIKKKIQEKSWFKGFAKKASAVTLASAITFGSIFGLNGCGEKEQNNQPETSTSDTQEVVSSLTGVIESLNTIISNLNTNNAELTTKLATIEQKLKDAQSDKENQEKLVADLTALVAEFQQ